LTVLEGFRLALEAMPEAHLTMVYRAAPLLSAVRASVTRERSMAARVHLLGARPHAAMAALFSGADLFVSGSHREGSGNALTEAIACGVVPVVTDIPPFQVLTDEGKAGALWRPGDAPGFASALRTVMHADRQALSAKGRKLFASKFSWPAVGARAMQIYRSVVDARRGARRR
jgi:glycosyltransferase involved in cell wall biosynthesis